MPDRFYLSLQVGFFDVVALPLFQNFGKVFPASRPLLAGVLGNYNHWQQQQHAR